MENFEMHDPNNPPKIFSKNREKLLKLEIQMHMKDYIKEREINSKDKELYLKSTNKNNSKNSSPEKQKNKFYSKYEQDVEETKNPVSRIISKNIITNNLITNNLLNNLNNETINKVLKTTKILSWLTIPTKYDEMNSYSKWWKFYDSCITMCNILVLILAIYDYELNFTYPRKLVNEYNIVRILMILISFLAIYFVLKRHHHKQKWRNVNLLISTTLTNFKYGGGEENSEDDDFFYNEEKSTITGRKRKFFRKGLLIDIIMNLMIPYPRLDFFYEVSEVDRENNNYIKVQYLFSDILYIMVILRLFYIIRATINYSIFTDHYANTIAKERGVKCNVRFALKCILKTSHIKIVFAFFTASIVLLGFALRVFERPYWAAKSRLEFEFLTNSVWLIFITLLTIGYGDFVPMTTAGRIVVCLSSLWGTFICSLVVVCLYGLLDLSNDQFLVFIKIVKSRCATKFIETAYEFRKAKLNRKNDRESFIESYSTLLDSYSEFKNMRNESKSIYRSNGLLYYNMKLLNEIKKFNQRFDKIEMDMESLVNVDEKTIKIS